MECIVLVRLAQALRVTRTATTVILIMFFITDRDSRRSRDPAVGENPDSSLGGAYSLRIASSTSDTGTVMNRLAVSEIA